MKTKIMIAMIAALFAIGTMQAGSDDRDGNY
jgi:hypothetical protein